MKSSALQTALVVAAAALALGGCDQLESFGLGGGNDSADTGANASADASASSSGTGGSGPRLSESAGTSSSSGSGAAANPLLEAQIAAAVSQLNSSTPVTVDAITTLTRVTSSGTEIVYEMAVSQNAPPGRLDAISSASQTGNQANLCRDPNASRLINMGASMRHVYTMPSGERWETRVSSCP